LHLVLLLLVGYYKFNIITVSVTVPAGAFVDVLNMGKFKRAGPASPQSPNKRHKTNDGEEAAASSQSSIKMDELELGAEPLEQGASGKLNEVSYISVSCYKTLIFHSDF